MHRDIKPGNVLMTADGTVKLTDFGISRAAGDATVTATGEILGTPAYTAPEVAQGHPVAFPADVFSLGATLYAAVEGTPPFGEDVNAMATLLRVVRNEIRQPRRSGPLTDTLMWMLTPEPVDRPTMKQVWQGLDALSAKTLPLAGITSRVPETTPFATPSPTLVVPDSVIPESPAPTPEPPAAAQPSAPATPKPKQKPKPKPTPAATSTPLPTPIEPASSASGPATESTKSPASTPTSVMGAAPTRNTLVPTSAAAKAPSSPTTPQPPAPHSPRRRGRLPLAIAVCVVGTTVLIVAIVVAMNAGKHSSPNQPVAHGSTSTAPSTPAKPTSTSQAPTTPSETPSSSASSSPSSSPSSTPSKPSSPSTSAADPATQMTTFITSYYALVPNNLTAAWPNMTEAYQTRVAQGFSNYQKFWSGYKSVSVSDVVAILPSTVVATLHYTDKNGYTTTERTSFGLVKEGGAWKIDTSNPAG